MVDEKKYKTIRIYLEDHQTLSNTYPHNLNFAEIIKQLVKDKI